MDETVAGRVREVVRASGGSQAQFARRVEMSPDKLSKSLGGVRRFSSLELALIAEVGGVSVDWLLTGRQAAAVSFAARGLGTQEGLEHAAERFTAAYDVLELLGTPVELPPLPEPGPGEPADQGARLAAAARELLAAQGQPPAAELETDRLLAAWEEVFGTDFGITALPPGVDGFAWQESGFRLALARRTDRWTRQRFTLAHELGHLLARDARQPLAESPVAPGRQAEPDEVRANAFAAHLLLPEAELREAATAGGEFAALVVRFRVSPSALAARLHALGLIDAEERSRLRRRTTAECHLAVGAMDRYLRQVALAEAERPPQRLARGLYAAYEAGETTLRPLAALLGTGPDELRHLLEQPLEEAEPAHAPAQAYQP
ncbi:helix-turn-helix domain-containing protein [Streptacidiphilus monticola]|uniref:Helix-turn-helix domain-containing protein n=1 Tax=Streptacidiphilus monticola TaxID=2161674 RepID=A0ABW1G424_9ACTN